MNNRQENNDRRQRPLGRGDRARREGQGFPRPRRGTEQHGEPHRERPARNPGDLRRSNSDERGRSPEIDEDITGKELDREASRQLGTLNDSNRKWVARHLVMAGRLIDIDPELAFEHALAASRRGGRLAIVREAVGLAAYAAGDYAEALRELRTYRRISGDHTHLPVMADCLRGLEKPEKAIELGQEAEAQKLSGSVRAELALVLSGAYQDLGNHASALAALEIPELDLHRAFSFSPRLYLAYAEVLETLGRDEDAEKWRAQIPMAERALGTGTFEDPEIMDFDDDEEPVHVPRAKDLLPKSGPETPAPTQRGQR